MATTVPDSNGLAAFTDSTSVQTDTQISADDIDCKGWDFLHINVELQDGDVIALSDFKMHTRPENADAANAWWVIQELWDATVQNNGIIVKSEDLDAVPHGVANSMNAIIDVRGIGMLKFSSSFAAPVGAAITRTVSMQFKRAR